MGNLGELIHHECDDEGPLSVFQHRDRRILTFGNTVEQSAMQLDRPEQLVHVYTQGMVLGLLLIQVKRVLVLGLGGGSLVRALTAADPDMHIDVVERRAKVIELARRYFTMPDLPGIRVHCEEAAEFIKNTERKYDLILADLYQAEGIDQTQLQIEFISQCRNCLSHQGWLLSNQWCNKHLEAKRAQAILESVFGESRLSLHVKGGNVIAYNYVGTLPEWNKKTFFSEAEALGIQLGIPMQKLARNFWRQNAEPMKLGRYRSCEGRTNLAL